MTLCRFISFWKGMIVLIALVVGTVTACSPTTSEAIPSTSGPTATVTAPVDLSTVISMAGRFSEEELAVLDEQIAAFEAKNPDLRVEIVEIRGNTTRQRETIADLLNRGDNSIDVFFLDSTWLARLGANGWLVPLDDYVKSQGVEVDGFLPVTVEASTIDGQLVALPWTTDVGLLYYRQDLFDKHGYEPPTTWADLQRIALEIKAKENLAYGFVWQGAAYENLTCNALEFIWAYGGDLSGEGEEAIFDSPQTQIALQQMSDLITSGTSPGEVTTYGEGQTLAAFQNGEAVFMRNWSYAWARLNAENSPLRGQVGVTNLPAACQIGQSLALSAYSLQPEKALRLMAFLADYEQQVQLAIQLGFLPVLEAAYDNADLLAAEPVFEDLRVALLAARHRPHSKMYPVLSEAIYTEVHAMLTGSQDVAMTATNIQHRIEAIAEQQ